jgi:hypothetical protein
VIATSVLDPTKSASANLIVVPAVVVGVTPANVSVTAGATQQFAASVTGTSNTAVAWTVSGTGCSGTACGTISSSGLYTAPAVTSPATVTTTATSVADPTKSASAEVTIVPSIGTTYYLATAANGGSDSNDGTSSGTPWLTPDHAVNCGDVIIAAASTAYVAANFYAKFGPVTCAAANNVAWLTCAKFDACKISGLGRGVNGMAINNSYWGIQGWEVDGAAISGPCFAAASWTGSTIHHIIFANDIANGCGLDGFAFSPESATSSFDYIAVVGNIAYNNAGGTAYCGTGIEVIEPIASDSLPGTHIYAAGNFAYDNVDAVCFEGGATDGEGIEFDTFDGSGGNGNPVTGNYSQQAVIDNNIALANGGPGLEVFLNTTGGGPFSNIYVRHNTAWGNNTDSVESVGPAYVTEILVGYAQNTQVFQNIAATNATKGAGGQPIYAYSVTNSNGTDHIYQDVGWAASGTYSNITSSSGFSFGPNNLFETNPTFANATDPGAPSCGSASSVPNCMATVIANFTPTNAAAASYGYQIPSSAQVYDPLFPQWLCNVNLPAGLVTMGCLSQ